MFIGRKFELQQLEKFYHKKSSKMVVIYGRRRIGKSSLVDTFAKNIPFLKFEGLEKQGTHEQLEYFTQCLRRQTNDKILDSVKFESWIAVFDYLTTFLEKNKKKKYVLFLDELQWLAVNQSKLISLLKTYWDNHWKQLNIMLVLCGSVSSFMVKRVINSNALYGRIDWELCLDQLEPMDSWELLASRRSKEEVFKYSLVFGGIPKYLEMINPRYSFEQNMNDLFFIKGSPLITEYEKVFYSQFREHKIYEKVIKYLAKNSGSLKEIAEHLSQKSGGGVKSYLENLEKSLFISSYVPFDKGLDSKLIKYKLTDEFLRFYLKYVMPNLKIIRTNTKRNLFGELVVSTWTSWLGFAFENYCLKNAEFLALRMGFADKIISYGPYFSRGARNFQVDLMYLRSDKTITLCEIKYYDKPITTSIVKEVNKKCELIDIPRGYTLEKALVSQYGADKALQEACYFHHIVSVNDLFTG